MPETLYQRLGGAERIAAIIEDSLDRHAVNPVLAARFHGKDLPRLKELGMRFFCSGANAQGYDGRRLRHLYAGMNVSEQELAAAVDDVVAALKAEGVAQGEVNEVVAMLYSLKADVVRL